MIVSMCRDIVTSFEELLCACVGCRPGYQGWAGQGRGQDQKTREQAASLHQPHRGTCTPHTCQPGVSSHSLYLPVYIAFVGELIFHVPLTVFHHQARLQQQHNCMKPGLGLSSLQSAGFRYFSEYLFHSLKMSRIINHAVYLFKVVKDHIRTFSPSQGPLLKIYLALTHQKHC